MHIKVPYLLYDAAMLQSINRHSDLDLLTCFCMEVWRQKVHGFDLA